MATIRVGRTQKNLGLYQTEADAARAFQAAASEIGRGAPDAKDWAPIDLSDEDEAAARAMAAACKEVGRDPPPAPSSRHRGVSWRDGMQKWCARITVGGERHMLGFFESEAEAAEACAAARCLSKPAEGEYWDKSARQWKARAAQSSRHPGVCWHGRDRKWQATAKGGKYLGSFDDEDDAARACQAALRGAGRARAKGL